MKHLYEYTSVASTLNEEGDDDEMMNPNGGGNQMPGGPDAMGGPEQGGGMMPQGGPDAMGGPNMGGPENGPDAMGGGMDASAPDMGSGGEAPEGFSPEGDGSQLGATPETDPNAQEDSDEEVIDVDELVDSQEDTERKIDRLSHKFEKVINMMDKFEELIDNNNRKMEELKADMEKRNPTPEEKMTMRSVQSKPFSTTPEEYWRTEAPANYSIEDDKNGEEMPEYKITKADIDNINDWQSISNSMRDYDFMNVRDLLGI